MSTHTIPGELFLLLTDDAGRQDSTQYRRQALAAAAVAELALREKIALSEERAPKVRVLDAEPTGLPDLDHALGALPPLDGKPVKAVIARRSMDLTEVIGEGFVAEGVVSRKDGWFLTSWPAEDDSLERALRARLTAALTDPSVASLQDGILLEMLRALRIAHRILKDDLPDVGRRELDRRIQQLAIDHPAATAVRKIMDDMAAAMIATTAAAGAVGAGG
ncbi:GOLPH3/VPS74 family protein [Brachybacterium sp. AOP43-C2-M15]|uniref:GOLPH3/VPS74 family protein n=1 Tax=Brachybacterium sp. AOP43-C2-M15 TaxID=3457661 RepID=UPI004033D278